jgi:hypothetical protein
MSSGPQVADIFSVGFPEYGTSEIGNAGPNVPYMPWDAQSTRGVARFTNNGQPPKSVGSIGLKSVDFISHQYLSPPVNDEADQLLMPDMLAFLVREMDPDEGTNVVLSLAALNKIMQDQWDDFVLKSTQNNNPYETTDAVNFRSYLQTYGERGLNDYVAARKRGDEKMLEKMNSEPGLREFWEMSTKEGYCYLTLHGILSKINYAGPIISTNRAHSLEDEMMTGTYEHYTQVVVGLAKRVRVANMFGTAENITTGSKLWVLFTRKYCGDGKYGAFAAIPGGCKGKWRPLSHDRTYVDEAGSIIEGHVFAVGVVIEPADRSPHPAALEQATNTGPYISAKAAYDAHALLPTMYIAAGFRN